MKTIFQSIFCICFLLSCNTTVVRENNPKGHFSYADLFDQVKPEVDHLYSNRIDTIYFIDSMVSYLSDYRAKLKSILLEEGLPATFDKAFLIETFFVYRKGVRRSIKKDSPYDLWTVLYVENDGEKYFQDISISKDCKKSEWDNVSINTMIDTTIARWLEVKTILPRQDPRGGFVSEWEDDFLVVTKLTPEESFCRVIINPFWNAFYGITTDQLPVEKIRITRTMSEISYLQYLTGKGSTF